MRKFLVVLLAATLFFAFAACSGPKTPSEDDLPTEIRVVGVDINGEVSTIYNPADPTATFPPENVITTNPNDTVGLDINGNPSTVYDPGSPSATFPPNNVYVTPRPPSATPQPTSTPIPVSVTTPTPAPAPTATPGPTPTPFEGGAGEDDFGKGSTVIDFGDLFEDP
ncbi:MAG: hypothetical protein FWF10_07705 [Clostridiales bacterium]|nr:hypothetical protein [Clostridiales bacterium]